MKLRFISLAVLILLTGCKGRKEGQMIIQSETSAVLDSTYIFDGKTLDGWEITNFGPQGLVDVSGGEIILGMGDGCTGITYKKDFPTGDYKVTLEAKRVNGTDFFCGMTFPAGKDPCTLIVGGWGGTTVGLSSIDGMDASENETTTHMKFDNDRWYDICLEVKESGIEAWIDDSLVVDFARNAKDLSIRPEVELSKPFGICSWNTTAALRNIRLELLKK
ncbi:MAG: family 16 glycoside hydrolase [Chloroflexota bacterium]